MTDIKIEFEADALEEKPKEPEKPSKFINRMVEMMTIVPTKTGNPQMDIIVRQLQLLAAHADAVDAFLDSQYE